MARTLAGGIEVAAAASDGFTASNWELSTLPPERIGAMVAEVAAAMGPAAGTGTGIPAGTMAGTAQPGAITVFCTNLAAADRVQDRESAFGIPVLDNGTFGERLRLEQEFISFAAVTAAAR